ncbi:MAG: acyltransferase [Candidatus Accumulibacter sp.]|nr:acyltransferase [Accumulibacter sp.]
MHWAEIGEVGFTGGTRLLFRVYRHCGRRPFRALLFFVIAWFFVTHGLARRASLDYLRHLHRASGGTTPTPKLRNSFRHFMNFAETLLDKMLACDVRLETLPGHTEGIEHFTRLIDEKRGALIITAHLGNLELCRRMAKDQVRIKLTVLAHTRHAQKFNRMLNALDLEQEVVDTIDITAAMRLSERVAAGGFVVIAGDRVPVTPGSATLTYPFLGEDACFPLGPYILAAALACPVLTLFSARRADGFSVTARLLAERIVLPRRERQQAILPYLREYVAALTEECQKNPLQWFNFFPFWQQASAVQTAMETNDEKL